MAIDAASYDSTAAAARPVVARERETSPSISRDSEPVEIEGDMSFGDFLGVINPLQHLPIIGTLYRSLTGDTIQPAARVMGGILYGGVIGGLASITNAVIEQASGQDVGDQVMTSLGFGEGAHPAAPVAVAAATGGTATAGSPVALASGAAPAAGTPPTAAQASAPVQMAQAAPQAAQKAADPTTATVGAPIKLAAAPPAAASPASAMSNSAMSNSAQAGPSLASLSGGAAPAPSKMPARDTPLASSTMVKHAVPKYAAPMPGSIPVSAQAANANVAASPEALSETMMRNLAKYEQSRKAVQSAAPAMRVSS
ncbi:hypothetical protein [Azospirillum sp.]|uniref:hypothetical protein n=1 Tax=Azospirillum sp. TaxID=34012 RepID=UPI002625A00B|nr:hypothetical protein [Azospirillum sp.]